MSGKSNNQTSDLYSSKLKKLSNVRGKVFEQQLRELADRLFEKYNLCTDKSKKNKNRKSSSKIKIGGGKRNNSLVFDFYISYEIDGKKYYLSIVQHTYETKFIFEIMAPKKWLSDHIPITELRPFLKDGKKFADAEFGQIFDNFEEASGYFLAIINQVAEQKINLVQS
jgi:hypothetical protein